MSNPVQPFKTSQPNYDVVTGRFCYPKPYAPGGLISANAALPRPLIVGTDVTITNVGGQFNVFLNTDLEAWGLNIGDKVHFEGTGIDGVYTIASSSGAFSSGDDFICSGPGQAVTTGYIWFDQLDQKITGVGTKFTKNIVGQKYIVIIDSALTPTVQVCKVARVENDTVLYVEKGFVTTVASEAFMITEGSLRGVSIKCGGAGVVMGAAVAEDDILTFYQDSGLDPVYGDSGANTFKILIQK
jgi:hypothetical protein